MSDRRDDVRSIAWAWAAGWVLVSIGQAISDVYSSPNRGLTAYYVLGLAGWIIGAAGTIRFVFRQFKAGASVLALSAAGWTAGSLMAVVWGLSLVERGDAGFWGLIAGPVLGGAIGGALTLPMQSLASPGRITRAILRGAFGWGAAFLVVQILAFYTWYMLYMLTADPLSKLFGPIWGAVIAGVLPAGLGGWLAGWAAARLVGFVKHVAD